MWMFDYFSETVPGNIEPRHQFRLLWLVFAFTFVSVMVIHQFLPGPQPWLHLILHSFAISISYLLAIVMVAVGLFFQQKYFATPVRVWHLWVLSFLAYNIGFFAYVPFGNEVRFSLHPDLDGSDSMRHYLRLLAVWFFISFVFVQTYFKQAIENENRQLRDITDNLRARVPMLPPAAAGDDGHLVFEAGRKQLDLPFARISHVSVDDHYCYIHFEGEGGFRKTDIGLPLKVLEQQLPPDFIAIHRSHLINPRHVVSVEKAGRSVSVRMGNGDELPVSRSRCTVVLESLAHLTRA